MVRGLLLILLILPFAGCMTVPSAGSHRSGFFGPYIGQVIDVDTGKGVPGVLVVAAWWRGYNWIIPIAPEAPSDKLIHVTEVFTDQDGKYRIPAFPPLWRRLFCIVNEPYIRIFKPGYGIVYADEEIAVSKGITTAERDKDISMKKWNRNHGKPEISKFKKLKTIEERRKYLGASNPSFCQPKCRILMNLYAKEYSYLAKSEDYPGVEK